MKDKFGFENMRLDGAEVIQGICVKIAVGEGTEQDPCRWICNYYTLKGEHLAEGDYVSTL